MSGALAGLRVVEFCDELGQLAGKLLADMGADVVKIEPPDGSRARTVGPFVDNEPGPNRSLNFWYYNTNKRSVVVDLGSDEGAERWRQLVAKADIVIDDRPPRWLEDRALGYSVLGSRKPELLWCSITPFGQTGPWANYQSTDMVALALGGPMMMNGYDHEDAPGAPPIRGHGDQGYNTACHYAVQGILAIRPVGANTSMPPCMKPLAARPKWVCRTGSRSVRTFSDRPAGMRPHSAPNPGYTWRRTVSTT
jgi:benzylsuccinate CoA-transferase BbsE subunit